MTVWVSRSGAKTRRVAARSYVDAKVSVKLAKRSGGKWHSVRSVAFKKQGVVTLRLQRGNYKLTRHATEKFHQFALSFRVS